jgi:hypothetical protein
MRELDLLAERSHGHRATYSAQLQSKSINGDGEIGDLLGRIIAG